MPKILGSAVKINSFVFSFALMSALAPVAMAETYVVASDVRGQDGRPLAIAITVDGSEDQTNAQSNAWAEALQHQQLQLRAIDAAAVPSDPIASDAISPAIDPPASAPKVTAMQTRPITLAGATVAPAPASLTLASEAKPFADPSPHTLSTPRLTFATSATLAQQCAVPGSSPTNLPVTNSAMLAEAAPIQSSANRAAATSARQCGAYPPPMTGGGFAPPSQPYANGSAPTSQDPANAGRTSDTFRLYVSTEVGYAADFGFRYVNPLNNYRVADSIHPTAQFGLAGGLELGEHWRMDAEITGSRARMKSTVTYPAPGTGPLGATATHNFEKYSLSLNAYYDFLPNGIINPYLGLGAGAEFMNFTDSQVVTPSLLGYELAVIGGVSGKVTNSLSLYLQAKYAYIDIPFHIPGSLALIEAKSPKLSVASGLRYAF